MNDRIRNPFDHQLKYATRVVILKQSPDGQLFWPIPDPPPPTIDACYECSMSSSVFRLPGQYDIACGDLLAKNPSSIGSPYWIRYLDCHLVEYVSIENASSFVIAKPLYDAIKLPNCIYLVDDFIKLHKPNPIEDLDGFFASLKKISRYSRLRFAILKQSPDRSFWPIPDPLPLRIDARLVWEGKPYYLFVLLEQHDIVCGDLLTGWYSRYYLVRQVIVLETCCLVFAELIDVVKLPDRVYFNNFIELQHNPIPIDDLAEFVANLTIGDVFANQWPPESDRANIYIFRDADVIFYVGSSSNVYKRIRAHLGIEMRGSGHSGLNDLVNDNLPDSLNWNIDLYRVNKTYVGDILSCESNIIRRLRPVINQQSNPCPTPLPMRYKWRLRKKRGLV